MLNWNVIFVNRWSQKFTRTRRHCDAMDEPVNRLGLEEKQTIPNVSGIEYFIEHSMSFCYVL